VSLPERAQAIRCGRRWLGFALGWARVALEQVELSRVPGAPDWLAGAANVDGEVLPVVDLSCWLEAEAGGEMGAMGAQTLATAGARDTRVLVGGQDEQSVGLLFTGLPRLVRVTPRPEGLVVPAALEPLVLGVADEDASLLILDGAALLTRLTQTLA
jgi:chemotaxis signal transduction protein